MKARHIKKLRKKLVEYDVQKSDLISGYFGNSWRDSIKVYAKNTRQACERANKRGYGLSKDIDRDKTRKKWADWRVKRSSKPSNFRHITYY